jgi:hypothetical protein
MPKQINTSIINAPFADKISTPNTEPIAPGTGTTNKQEFVEFSTAESSIVGVPNELPQVRVQVYKLHREHIHDYIMTVVNKAVIRGYNRSVLGDLEYFEHDGRAQLGRILTLQALATLVQRLYVSLPKNMTEQGNFAKCILKDPPKVLKDFQIHFSLLGNYVSDQVRTHVLSPLNELYHYVNLFCQIYDAEIANDNWREVIFNNPLWVEDNRRFIAYDPDFTLHVLHEARVLLDQGPIYLAVEDDDEHTFKVAISTENVAAFHNDIHHHVNYVAPDAQQQVRWTLICHLDEVLQGMPYDGDVNQQVNEWLVVADAFRQRRFRQVYPQFSDVNGEFVLTMKNMQFVECSQLSQGWEGLLCARHEVLSEDGLGNHVNTVTVSSNKKLSFADVGYSAIYGFVVPITVNPGYKYILEMEMHDRHELMNKRFERLSLRGAK